MSEIREVPLKPAFNQSRQAREAEVMLNHIVDDFLDNPAAMTYFYDLFRHAFIEGKVKPVRRHIAEAMGLPVQGKLATYRCGNPLCVHPDHLMVITRKKLQQRIAKEQSHQMNPLRRKKISDRARIHAKLTLEQAQAIRDAEGTQREIAKLFGITQATVSVIKRGVTWRDYTNPFTQLIGGSR